MSKYKSYSTSKNKIKTLFEQQKENDGKIVKSKTIIFNSSHFNKKITRVRLLQDELFIEGGGGIGG